MVVSALQQDCQRYMGCSSNQALVQAILPAESNNAKDQAICPKLG
jgi:hypothetical protein